MYIMGNAEKERELLNQDDTQVPQIPDGISLSTLENSSTNTDQSLTTYANGGVGNNVTTGLAGKMYTGQLYLAGETLYPSNPGTTTTPDTPDTQPRSSIALH